MAVPFIRLLTFSIGVFIYSLHGQPLDQDGFCPPSAPVLCVREVLMAITAMTKNINRTLNQIENDILENVQITETLNRYVQYELNLIYFRLPTPQLHMQFFQMNNIDEKYFHELLLEAHYAMGFYYNTISDILDLKNPYAVETDKGLKQVQMSVRYDIICRYRTALNVYSYQRPKIESIGRIEFSKRKYLETLSLTHDVRSIITVRLMREWMRRMQLILMNIEVKLS